MGRRMSRAAGRLFTSDAILTSLLLSLLRWLSPARALENGLARTPPMGWLAWERFTCQVDCARYPDHCINSRLFEQMSERLATDRWLALGYDHVNIDDCWSELQRDNQSNRLVPDHERFPAGIKTLADSVHAHRGLKLGLYGDCGTRTCGGYPGQLKTNDTQEEDDYATSTWFKLDADTLAEWQVDSLKFDGCYVSPTKAERICSRMAAALAATRRPIMLVCEWPFYMMYAHAEPDWKLAADSCNVWRYYDDIEDSWLSVLNTIDYTIRHQATMLKYHGPGHWFDPDQLVIGNFGLSPAQARAQMAIWCIWAAPLYMSNDLRDIRPEFVQILQNEHLIGVDQDRLGVLGLMVKQSQDGLQQAFVKPVLPVRNKCPSFAVVLLNRATLGNKQKVSFELADLLLGAPIKQAAVNQAHVLYYERSMASAAAYRGHGKTPTTGQAEGWTDQLLEAASGSVELMRMEQIDTLECLERLARASKAADQPQAEEDSSALWAPRERPANGRQAETRYELLDLFDGAKSLGSLAVHDKLELLVEPSSVRALKLVEK